MDKVTYVGNADVNAVDHLYESYVKDPQSVDIGWQKFFEGFDFARTNFEESGDIPENFQKEFKVINLIDGYRNRGHLFTKTNPVRDRRSYYNALERSQVTGNEIYFLQWFMKRYLKIYKKYLK